jgi:hypothetical protein
LSHWTKKLPVSSTLSSMPISRCTSPNGGPGYSACPHMQRVISSSAASMSFSGSSSGCLTTGSLSSPFRRLLRGAVCSARAVESAPSADSGGCEEERRG